MLRMTLRFAIALLALVSLSGCAIERLTGPNVELTASARDRAVPYWRDCIRTERQARPRDDDPKLPPTGGEQGDGIATASDTLRAGGEDR